jgi:predicted RNA-binding protein associated with RNAse of E/G family
LRAGHYFGVDLFFGGSEFVRWYVNFERPYVRTRIGIDTFDLLLDLLVEPDLSYRWKDEDEYAHGRRLGLVTQAEHRSVQRARERVVELIERRAEPFDERWQSWRPDPGWPQPRLPAAVTTI